MSPSTSNVNAGAIELIPTLVAGVPCTLTIVAPKPTCNKSVVVIPETAAFDAVKNPTVPTPDTKAFVAVRNPTVPTPIMFACVVVVTPVTKAFDVVVNPRVAIPVMVKLRALTSSKVKSPLISTLPLK